MPCGLEQSQEECCQSLAIEVNSLYKNELKELKQENEDLKAEIHTLRRNLAKIQKISSSSLSLSDT